MHPLRLVTVLLLGWVTASGETSGQIGAPPVPPARPTGDVVPWQSLLAMQGDPPPLRPACFVPFDLTKSLLQDSDLHDWFEIPAGQSPSIFRARSRRGMCGAIDGLIKLKMPWRDGVVLRFALDDYNRLQIHLFRGTRGATLVYHEDDLLRWAGYATQRRPGSATPGVWHLTSTDDWRNRRTAPKNHDHYELRCQDGEVVLNRGDIALLRVPLGGLPEEVYFQGKSLWYGLSATRAAGFPVEDPPRRPVHSLSLEPTAWVSAAGGANRLEQLPGGGLRLLASSQPDSRNWAAVPVPRDLPGQIVLEIEDARPGAGIFLGDGQGPPRDVLRYVSDRRSGQMCLRAGSLEEATAQDFPGLLEAPWPAVAAHHWVRLVRGAGMIRWWISVDGIHWAEPAEPIRNRQGAVTHVGLFCGSQRDGDGITVKRCTLEPLSGLRPLSEGEWYDRAAAVTDAATAAQWLDEIAERSPPGVNQEAWRRACALRSLAAGCPRELGNELLMQLADDQAARRLPMEQRLVLLADTARLLDVWDDSAMLQRLVTRYHECGLEAFARDGTPPLSSIRSALMTTPVATRHQLEVATEELLRAEILQLVYSSRWQRVLELGSELRWYQMRARSPLLDWAESVALRELPAQQAAGVAVSRLKEEWRQPLVEELSKELYDALAQLRVELELPGRDDAARTIASLGSGGQSLAPGPVAPHWREKQLSVSLLAAVRSAVQSDSRLQARLRENFRDLAQLRIRQSMDAGDADAVALAAEQFAGTRAALDAHLWLGDRALASGAVALAAAEYDRAWRTAPPLEQPAIAARRQLALALIGRPSRLPLPDRVVMGDRELAAPQFQSLLEELAESAAAGLRVTDLDQDRSAPDVATPPPATYRAARHARLRGPVGNDPSREFIRDVGRQQLDWVDRQCRVVVRQRQMYLCNRFHVTAFDLDLKQPLWQSAAPPGQIQFAQEATFTACRPLVTPDRVLVRLRYGSGATLVSLQRSTGQMLWSWAAPQNEEFVSDPFLLKGKLVCLTLRKVEQQEFQLRLSHVDERTGFVWKQQDLVQLRESWRVRRYCETATCADGVLVALGGVIIRLDSSGRIVWIRTQVVTPATEESQWTRQHFQPPLLSDGRAYALQPGVRTIDCLDVDTGVLVWSRLFLDAERLIGLNGELLIVQRERGFQALDRQTGAVRWQLAAGELTVGVTCSSSGDLLYARRQSAAAPGQPLRLWLVWVNTQNGQVREATELPDLEGNDPRLGPLVVDGQQIWTFWGNGQTDATRDIVELSPVTPR